MAFEDYGSSTAAQVVRLLTTCDFFNEIGKVKFMALENFLLECDF